MRTTLLDADGNPRYTNRLVDESSPYLVQHAHNPVDWYPWGEEAFSRARQEDKPVFLSIGYSTCHWCHVMEHESFDNEEIAAFLNRHFVSIKLDREQRPDLDELYMTGVQMLTGQGGWPMSNFLTVDGKPFYAATYFPAANFLALLQQIAGIWKERRDDVLKQAEEIAAGIARFTTARAEARSLPEDLYGSASVELLGRFDEVNGGFGGAPKFPNESMLMLLLDDWQRNGNRRALDASMHTLAKMSEGGIHDQVGGGFHRYTVDAVWLVPHFEKMLYNQAQMIRLYSGAAALTGSAACRRVVEKTFAYLTRDMMDDDGAFYSATDADSEGEEGLFFLWTRDELETVLGADDAALVEDVYGVTAAGNFEGRNILHLAVPLAEFASARDIPEAALAARLETVHERLYRAREERVHPLRDEKIITAWNAMTVTSLAQAGHEMAREDMLAAAIRAATAVWNRAWDAEAGTLWRISFAGQVSVPGNLEDYACLSEALLSLYRFTFDRRWLERGREMVMRMIEEFADEEGGGFFLARRRDEGPMIARPKSPMDGATPSANSVALSSLVLLNAMTGDPEIEARITACINAFAGLMVASPSAFPYMICAAGQYRHGLLGQVRFAGAGNVRVACHRDDAGCRLELTFADGWHVNAHEVADPSLIGTEVDAGAATVEYPRGQAHRYEEAATITISGDVAAFDLRLQACSEDRCLAPETLHFR